MNKSKVAFLITSLAFSFMSYADNNASNKDEANLIDEPMTNDLDVEKSMSYLMDTVSKEDDTPKHSITTENGYYFINWESEDLNEYVSSDYLEQLQLLDIKEIRTQLYPHDNFDDGPHYIMFYSRYTPYGYTDRTIIHENQINISYNDIVTGKEKEYTPNRLGYNITIKVNDDGLQVKKREYKENRSKTYSDNLLSKMETTEYYKQQYVDTAGAIVFALSMIPEDKEDYNPVDRSKVKEYYENSGNKEEVHDYSNEEDFFSY